jgi:hypothetical protein
VAKRPGWPTGSSKPGDDHAGTDVLSAAATCRATACACVRNSGTAVHSQRTPRMIGPSACMRGFGRPIESSRLSVGLTSRPRPWQSSRPRPRLRSAPSSLSGEPAAFEAPVASNTRTAWVDCAATSPRGRQLTRSPPSHGSAERIVRRGCAVTPRPVRRGQPRRPGLACGGDEHPTRVANAAGSAGARPTAFLARGTALLDEARRSRRANPHSRLPPRRPPPAHGGTTRRPTAAPAR